MKEQIIELLKVSDEQLESLNAKDNISGGTVGASESGELMFYNIRRNFMEKVRELVKNEN